ncbi:MAG: MFS transporter [Candidatus Hodarchaeota archaeon]
MQRKISRLSPFLVIVMTIFIDVTGFGIVLPLLPYYAVVFQAGSTELGVLVTSFALMQFIFSPVLGRLSDRIGRRPVLLLSILTSAVSFLLFALANSFIMLLLSRMVAGMATEVGVAQAYIADITEKKERTARMGRMGAVNGAGFIIGPALGGFLSTYGFSAAGYAAAALAIVNLVFALFFLPESRVNATREQEEGKRSSIIQGLANALSKPLMGSLLAIMFTMRLAFSAFPVVMPLLAMSLFGLGSSDMSYFFVYIGLVQIVFQGFVVGRLASKVGDGKLIAVGSLLMMSSVFPMAFFANFGIFLVLSTVMVSGGGMLGTAIPSFISKRTSADEQGGVLGVTQSISSVAGIPGPLIGGSVYEYAGLTAPFLLSGALLAIASAVGIRISLRERVPSSGN